MIEESDQAQFYKILCSNSVNKSPKLAVLEWEFVGTEEERTNCICGMPIKENCFIQNIKNHKTLIVGNVCINKFLEKDYSFIFKGVKACRQQKMPNKDFINYCFEKGYMFESQQKFLLNMHRKRKYTPKQKEFKTKILYKLGLRTTF